MIHQPSKSPLVRTTPLVLTFWLCSFIAPPTVWACCDNVFSCAAAVVTAGVTCVIDEAANALRGLIRRVEHERELKRLTFNTELESSQREAQEAAQQLKQLAQQRADELRRYLQEANQITANDKAWISNSLKNTSVQQLPGTRGLAAVPNRSFDTFKQLPAPGIASDRKPSIGALTQPALPGSTIDTGVVTIDDAPAGNKTELQLLLGDTSLETLKRQIEIEQRRGEAARKRAEAAMKNALLAIEQSTQNTHSIFQSSFLGPVDRLLAALQAVLNNPLNAGQLITGALGILDGAFSAFDRDVVPVTELDAQVKQTGVASVKREADQTQRHAETAKHILAEMRKGAQLKTVAERRALVSAASASAIVSTANVGTIVSLKSPYRLLAMSKTLRTDLMTIRPDLQRLATQMQRPDLAPIQARLAASFDQYFKGKQPAEVKTIRDQLILEARRRYGADRNLLTSIEQLINDEARARGVF